MAIWLQVHNQDMYNTKADTKKKKISFMTKIHLQSFGFFNNKYLQCKDSA